MNSLPLKRRRRPCGLRVVTMRAAFRVESVVQTNFRKTHCIMILVPAVVGSAVQVYCGECSGVHLLDLGSSCSECHQGAEPPWCAAPNVASIRLRVGHGA